jgi:hypothetical protein
MLRYTGDGGDWRRAHLIRRRALGDTPRNESKLKRHRLRSPYSNINATCTDANPATFQSGKDRAVGLHETV